MFEEYWSEYHSEMRSDLKNGFFRLLDKSLESGDISDDFFDYLASLPVETIDEQEEAYKELARSIIQTRLMKGAIYLERTDLTKEKREKAENLYNQLCTELASMK